MQKVSAAVICRKRLATAIGDELEVDKLGYVPLADVGAYRRPRREGRGDRDDEFAIFRVAALVSQSASAGRPCSIAAGPGAHFGNRDRVVPLPSHNRSYCLPRHPITCKLFILSGREGGIRTLEVH